MLLTFHALSLDGNLYESITYQSYCSQRASLLAYRIPRVFLQLNTISAETYVKKNWRIEFLLTIPQKKKTLNKKFKIIDDMLN